MIQGQKVVCINDYFQPGVRALFKELPVKGKVYVIRSVYLGRSRFTNKTAGASDGEVGVLLVGVNNPPDSKHLDACEIGFSSERFRPLEDVKADATKEKEAACAA